MWGRCPEGTEGGGFEAMSDPTPRVDPPQKSVQGRAAIIFYRALVQSGQTALVEAMAEALAARGMAVTPIFVSSLKDEVSAATVARLAEDGMQATVDTVELRDLAHDITNNLLTGFAPPALESAINTVVSADGVIVVTPIFSTSYSGLFKSFIDVLDPDALQGKPVLIGANAGTARHSLAIDYALRPLFTYLHADPVPTGVFAASSDWRRNTQSSLCRIRQRRRSAPRPPTTRLRTCATPSA